MANSLNGVCGHVSKDGSIISNGNCICKLNTNTLTYSVGYNGSIYKGYPVISVVGKVGLSYLLEETEDGFDLTISKYGSAVKADFNFIVGDLA